MTVATATVIATVECGCDCDCDVTGMDTRNIARSGIAFVAPQYVTQYLAVSIVYI